MVVAEHPHLMNFRSDNSENLFYFSTGCATLHNHVQCIIFRKERRSSKVSNVWYLFPTGSSEISPHCILNAWNFLFAYKGKIILILPVLILVIIRNSMQEDQDHRPSTLVLLPFCSSATQLMVLYTLIDTDHIHGTELESIVCLLHMQFCYCDKWFTHQNIGQDPDSNVTPLIILLMSSFQIFCVILQPYDLARQYWILYLHLCSTPSSGLIFSPDSMLFSSSSLLAARFGSSQHGLNITSLHFSSLYCKLFSLKFSITSAPFILTIS